MRTMLCLAALHASRCDPTFGAFRARMQKAGKPVETALVATAGKLLCTLNAMVAAGAD
jgi:transposase